MKRTYETGSIQDLGNGKFRLRASGGRGVGGKYVRHSKVIQTSIKKDPEQQLRDAERQLAVFVKEKQGKEETNKTVTWLINEFKEMHVESLRPNTRRNYNLALRRFKAALGHVKLTDLKPSDIQKYYKMLLNPESKPFDKLKNGLSTTSVKSTHQYVSAMLYWGYDQGYCDRPIIDKVKPPAVIDAEKRSLNDIEVKAFKAILNKETPLVKTFFLLALQTGMRRGELMGLQWKNIDIANETIKIQHSYNPAKGGGVLAEPKTKRSKRTIETDMRLLTLWKAEQERQKEDQKVLWFKNDYVFTDNIGKPLNHSWVLNKNREIYKKAKIENATLHTLRHTCTTTLIMAGVPVTDVAAFMGHSSAKTTLDNYSHASQGYASKCAEAIKNSNLV